MRELWTVRDRRDCHRVTIAAYNTREQVEQQIQRWVDRDLRGKRPDVHDAIPFLEPCLTADCVDRRAAVSDLDLAEVAAAIERGDAIVCYTRCEPCQFDCHFDPTRRTA